MPYCPDCDVRWKNRGDAGGRNCPECGRRGRSKSSTVDRFALAGLILCLLGGLVFFFLRRTNIFAPTTADAKQVLVKAPTPSPNPPPKKAEPAEPSDEYIPPKPKKQAPRAEKSTMGTLDVHIPKLEGGSLNVEFFIDGVKNPMQEVGSDRENKTYAIPVSVGPHVVELRKNGIPCFATPVHVRSDDDGPTFLQVVPELFGTIVVRNSVPITVGVRAQVVLNGVSFTEWPAGQDHVEVKAFVGLHIVVVRTTAPSQRVIAVHQEVRVTPTNKTVLPVIGR